MTRQNAIDTAMVLAAGLGTRMRPITNTTPKPLVKVCGKPLIDYAFEALHDAGVDRAVVNLHHLSDAMKAHLATVASPAIAVSDETEKLLDSGGGIVKALPLLGPEPFFVINADTFWLEDPDAGSGNLSRMAGSYDAASTDILMLVVSPENATGHAGAGDFTMDAAGRLRRFRGEGRPYIYAGALVLHPRIFAGLAAEPFSLNRCFDQAIAADRMRGLELAGHWLTVGTPDAIAAAETAIESYRRSPLRSAS